MCTCETCRQANVTAPVVTTMPVSFGALVPPVNWCGEHHAHGPHTYVGRSGLYVQCPGSNCPCGSSGGEQK